MPSSPPPPRLFVAPFLSVCLLSAGGTPALSFFPPRFKMPKVFPSVLPSVDVRLPVTLSKDEANWLRMNLHDVSLDDGLTRAPQSAIWQKLF